MKAIFVPETFDQIGQFYFIPHALDLLFGLVPSDSTIRPSALSSHLVPLMDAHDKPPRARAKASRFDAAKVGQIIEENAAFISKVSQISSVDFVWSLQGIYHNHPKAAHRLWITLFPSLWNALSHATQSVIMEGLQGFLSSPTFIKQNRLRPNTIQTVLAGFQACSPPVELPASLLSYCAKTFDCWHTVIRILETKLVTQLPNPPQSLFNNLSLLYRSLNEDDYYHGLEAQGSVMQDTRSALAYEQMGLWTKAQRVLTQAQRDYEHGVIKDVPYHELELWQLHWEESCRKLGQWDVLCEFAKANSRYDLVVQSAWKLGEWVFLLLEVRLAFLC